VGGGGETGGEVAEEGRGREDGGEKWKKGSEMGEGMLGSEEE